MAVITKEMPGMLIVEFMSMGRLSDFLVSVRDPQAPPANQMLPPGLRIKIAAGIACGMDFLASRGYVHKCLQAKYDKYSSIELYLSSSM